MFTKTVASGAEQEGRGLSRRVEQGDPVGKALGEGLLLPFVVLSWVVEVMEHSVNR